MNCKTVRALLVRPGKEPEPIIIEATDEKLKSIVGENLKVYMPFFETPICYIAGEENMRLHREVNRPFKFSDGYYDSYFYGTFLICAYSKGDYRLASLSPEDERFYRNLYKLHKLPFPITRAEKRIYARKHRKARM